jgi:branched-chain amino acid transport system permease protein
MTDGSATMTSAGGATTDRFVVRVGRNGRAAALVATTVGVLVTLPVLVTPYWQFVFANALVYAIAALSVNVLFGQAGMIGLFPASFVGTGAYALVIAHNHASSWAFAGTAAVLFSALVGGLVGLPGARLRGMTFGIVALAFALAMDTLVFRHGILGIDPALGASIGRPTLPGIDLLVDQTFYYFILVIAALTWAVVAGHERTRPGRAWRAVRDNELTALASGVAVARYRVWAAALSGGVAGVAGVLFVTLQGQTNVESFTPVQSLIIFTAAMTGGTRSPYGALIAGALLVIAPALLRSWGVSGELVPVIFAVGALSALRGGQGIAGSLRALGQRRRRDPGPSS